MLQFYFKMEKTNGSLLEKPSKIKKYSIDSISKCVKNAARTLTIEAQTIQNLTSCLDEGFRKSVTIIAHMEGRVVVTGIGKSALIGRKLVATLNSTGTPAIFMHAADAIHGDLGMIQPYDVVLCMSKSGETPEIKVLIPLLKIRGSQLIAMVSNKASYLGIQADAILHTPVEAEADPNNLAPTASTAAQLAMGDALAMALLTLRGFSSDDFAQIHPGGALGKQLYLRVNDVYAQHESPMVHTDASIRTTIVEMTSKRLGCTAVLNEKEQLVGIITDGDLRRMLAREADVSHLNAGEIMSPNPKTIAKDTLAVAALELMRQHSITQLIVMDGTTYLGIIHLHDLLREGLV